MQEAKLDHAFITKFCEQMLFRPGMPQEGAMTPREWTQQKQILLKYVQVSCSYLAHQQAVADARIAQVTPPLICRLTCHSPSLCGYTSRPCICLLERRAFQLVPDWYECISMALHCPTGIHLTIVCRYWRAQSSCTRW